MKKSTSQFYLFLLMILILLLFLRIDYRFKNTVECCSDEYDYYIHATTIVDDFDLDYSNQNLREFNYTYNYKSAPVGFVGTGILNAPFLLIGKYFSKIFNESFKEQIFNYQILFYSISSVIYFFLSFLLIYKTNLLINFNLDKYRLFIIFSGSGVSYYSFERFGMTHVPEVFTLSLLIYILTSYYLKNKFTNIKAFLINPVILISFLTRMSNLYIFLIPFIVKKFLMNKFNIEKKLYKNYYFLISLVGSIIIYLKIVNLIYGRFIFNPQNIYGDTRTSKELFGNFFNIPLEIIEVAFTSLKVLFSFEFGIFWMSPILFFGTIYCLIKFKTIYKLENILLFLCFAQNYVIIYLWKSAASSYGYRYLLSLVPLSCFLLFINQSKNSLITNYLTYFSIFSLIGVIFFETTELTQLSLEAQYNSFGKYIRYVQPDYVKGVLLAIFKIESYLIIFSTSFLGAIFFKIFLLFFGKSTLEKILYQLGLPLENNDFQNLLENLTFIGFDKFLVIIFIFTSFSYFFIYKLKE